MVENLHFGLQSFAFFLIPLPHPIPKINMFYNIRPNNGYWTMPKQRH